MDALRLSAFTDVDAAGASGYIEYLDSAFRIGPAKDAAYAAQGIAPGNRVLDVGCGIGDDVRALAAFVGERGSVVGIDSSRGLLEEAKRRGLPANACVLEGSAYELPFAENEFDACRAERLFQHLERPGDAAAELRRVVAPGGSVLLVDQDWETIVVAGGDADVTRRIVRAFTDSLANGWAGRKHAGLLARAGFRDVVVAAGVNSIPFPLAYAFVLRSAVAAAKAAGAVSPEEGDAWVRSLMAAEREREFYYGVSMFVATGRK